MPGVEESPTAESYQGDIDAPSSPPCSRCRRESRECVFAPSRRGGNHARRSSTSGPTQSEQDFGPPYGASIHDLIHPSPSSNIFPTVELPGVSDTPSPKRRRLHLNPPMQASDPSSIVVADMQNESDALQILALASGQGVRQQSGRAGPAPLANLADFPLVRLGILDPSQLITLIDSFFQNHHHFFVSASSGVANKQPVVPPERIPRTTLELSAFAEAERHLVTAAIIIASKHHPGTKDIHDKAWAVMRVSLRYGIFSDPTGLDIGCAVLGRRSISRNDRSPLIVGGESSTRSAQSSTRWTRGCARSRE